MLLEVEEMAENNYNNFIGEYETVRKVLKDMYVFGCYRNTDYQKRLGISISAYEKELKRMQFYIQPENRVKNRDSYNKIYGFSYDRYRNEMNYFVNSYKLKSYTQKYLQIYITIMQILSSQKEHEFSISELLEVMSNNVDTDEKEITRKIADLVEQGIVKKITERNRHRYQIVSNPLDKMKKEELMELYYAVDFFSVKFPFRTPVIFLKETIERYIRRRHHAAIEKKSLFIYEYNFLHTIFNDIITNDLVMAMEENRVVEVEQYQGSLSAKKKKGSIIFYPYTILSEYWYGRQYILGVDDESKKAVSIRIDRIRRIKILQKKFVKGEYQQEVNQYQKSWCVSPPRKKNHLVEVDFFYNAEEGYIKKMVEEDKKWGTLEEIEDGHFVYRIHVNDPIEMKPWIRKFGKHAKVREESQPEIAKELEKERQELLKNYGIISRE